MARRLAFSKKKKNAVNVSPGIQSIHKKKKKEKGKRRQGAGTPKEGGCGGGFPPPPGRPGSSSPDCAASGRRAHGTRTINSHGHKLPQEVLAAHQLLNKIDGLPLLHSHEGLAHPPSTPLFTPGRRIPPVQGTGRGWRGRAVAVSHTDPPRGRTGPKPR